MNRPRLSFRARLDAYLLAGYLIVSCILLAFSSGGFIVDFKSIGFSLMSGSQRGFYTVTGFFTGTVTAIRELSDLREKYRELSERLSDYELLQRANADIRVENDRLKALLGFSESVGTRNIPAQIIGRDPNNIYSGITINRGAKQGIRKNMAVISFQGGKTGLVGKIVDVGRNSSLIMPIFDFDCFVSARLEKSRYDGLLSGQGDSDSPLIMKYVKKRAKDEIAVGDEIITSGENPIYPKDVPIGFVSAVRGLDYETSLELDVEPVIDFSRLETVFVLDRSESDTGENK